MRIRYIAIILTFLFISASLVTADWRKVDNSRIEDGYEDSYWLEVYFLPDNPDFGWLCGFLGRTARTTDGGQTWQGSKLPKPFHLESIIFVNEQIGYTSGAGVIYKSTDGGINWFDVTPESQSEIWGCYFLDPDNGWAVGGGCNSPFSPQNFYKTTNGGVSWTKFEGNEPESGLTDIRMFEVNGLGYASSSGRLWATQNGGQTWRVISVTGFESWQEELSIYGNSFLVPFTGNCWGGNSDNFTYGGARFSVDGGNTWRETDVQGKMFGTFLLDETTGWMCGQESKAYKTTDAGATWFEDNCGIDLDDDLDDVYFLNEDKGWMVGSGIYETYEYPPLEPQISIEGDSVLCVGEETMLVLNGEYENFEWSTGETNDTIYADSPGEYFVHAWIVNCDSAISNSIGVIFRPEPEVEITMPNGPLCEGDTTTLSATDGFNSYLWSTGETTREIEIWEPGVYTVTVSDEFGCTGTADKIVDVIPLPDIEIFTIGDPEFCKGDSIKVIVIGNIESYDIFRNGTLYNEGTLINSNRRELIIKDEGDYFLVGDSPVGCEGTSNVLFISVRDDSNRLAFEPLEFTDGKYQAGEHFLTKMGCMDLTVKNIGGDDFILTDNRNFFIRNIEFSLPPSQFPITIPPYSNVKLRICINPLKTEISRDTLFLQDNCSPHYLPVVASVNEIVFFAENKCGSILKQISDGYEQEQFVTLEPYPNPGNGTFLINYADYSRYDHNNLPIATIYNMLGENLQTVHPTIEDTKEINEGIVNEGSYKINLDESYTNGIYLVRIANGEKAVSYKLILNR